MTRIFKRVWQYLGHAEWDSPHNCCPLCGYVAVMQRSHYCPIAQAVITWEEDSDGD